MYDSQLCPTEQFNSFGFIIDGFYFAEFNSSFVTTFVASLNAIFVQKTKYAIQGTEFAILKLTGFL